jgi:hypothetical protein
MAKSKLIDRDRGWSALKEHVKRAGKIAVKVGILEAAGNHQNVEEGEPQKTVAELAVVNEYGSSDGRIPARPAWRNSLDESRERITKALGKVAEEIVGGAAVEVAMSKIGLLGQAIVRRGITRLREPPNAPLTIAKKGSSNPLIDTSQTRNAVTFELLRGSEVDAARDQRRVR